MKKTILLAMTAAGLSCPAVTFAVAGSTPSQVRDYYVAAPEQAPDIKAYNEALKKNTAEGWNQFLQAYPTSLYKNNALMKRLQVIETLYKENSKGDGNFFDFHGPVRSITERMFYSDDIVEYHFDRNEIAEGGFKRDSKGLIIDYEGHAGSLRPYFIRESEYGRIVEFGYANSAVKSKLSYNEHGLLTKEVIYNSREDIVAGRIEYTYIDFDNHGNWIAREKTVVKNARVVGKDVETRVISYWGEAARPAATKPVATSKGSAIYKNLNTEPVQKDYAPEFKSLTPEEKMKAISRKYKEDMHGDGGFFDFHGKVKTLTAKVWGAKETAEYQFDKNSKVAGNYTRDNRGYINSLEAEGSSRAYFDSDANGRIIKYGDTQTSVEVVLKYNPYGLLNCEETHLAGATAVDERNEYSYTQYDDHGNWTARTKTTIKNSKVIGKVTETRKITYWE